jgi:hypothetical protein
MAHYAFIDETNIVVEIITGKDETELIDGLTPEQWYENFRGLKCVRTSFNTRNGKHYDNDGVQDNGVAFRGNYAVIGFIYDPIKDAFYAPKFYNSWNLNENTYQWEAPVSYPTDGKSYDWNEETLTWVEVITEA